MLSHLLRSSRPLSWINTAYPFAAAYLLAGGDFSAALVIGTAFFLVPYNVALYGINDVFDYPSDVANPRKGGVEGGLIPPHLHKRVIASSVWLCLPFLVFLAVSGSLAATSVLALSLLFLVAYSAPPLRTKETPVLDSFTSSMHFVSPALYGLVLAGGSFTAPAIGALLAFLLWGMASHAFGAVQDIGPDTDAGISSIATAFGARWTVRLSMALWLLAGAAMLTTGWPTALLGLLALPYLAVAAPFWNLTDSQAHEANRGWRHFLWLNYLSGAIITISLILIHIPLP